MSGSPRRRRNSCLTEIAAGSRKAMSCRPPKHVNSEGSDFAEWLLRHPPKAKIHARNNNFFTFTRTRFQHSRPLFTALPGQLAFVFRIEPDRLAIIGDRAVVIGNGAVAISIFIVCVGAFVVRVAALEVERCEVAPNRSRRRIRRSADQARNVVYVGAPLDLLVRLRMRRRNCRHRGQTGARRPSPSYFHIPPVGRE